MRELEKIPVLAEALHQRFGGREPFQIVTHLLEECGELAQEVSHFEGSETKLTKELSENKIREWLGDDFLTIRCTCLDSIHAPSGGIACGHGRKHRPYEKTLSCRGEPCDPSPKVL